MFDGSVGAVTKMGKTSIRVAIQNGGTFDVEPVTWEDVDIDTNNTAVQFRREMEQQFAP